MRTTEFPNRNSLRIDLMFVFFKYFLNILCIAWLLWFCICPWTRSVRDEMSRRTQHQQVHQNRPCRRGQRVPHEHQSETNMQKHLYFLWNSRCVRTHVLRLSLNQVGERYNFAPSSEPEMFIKIVRAVEDNECHMSTNRKRKCKNVIFIRSVFAKRLYSKTWFCQNLIFVRSRFAKHLFL